MAYTFKHGDRPIDGYTIQRAVGKGGFGEVYYAVSDGGREVALKYLRDNPQVELRGVSHCINLKSPHLVSIFDVKKTTDDEYAVIMEYCSGPSLRDLLLAEPQGFGPQKAAFFAKEIAKGLAYLHDRGIVHRDLKPGNLFYDDGYVKIGDYGLSKFISVSRHSAQTASVGTVHYMAPEIGSGNYSRGVDIYALGVILYEMLLGKVPFDGSTMAEVLMKHLTAQPELDQLPQPFGKVIRRALQKDPNDRYQTVDDMIGELLEAEDIRESVAGFRPQSLEKAVRHVGGQRFESPVPSPNPVPGQAGPFGGGADSIEAPLPDGGFGLARDVMKRAREAARGQPPFAQPVLSDTPLPDRVAKRMERVAHRLEKKMAKLAGRPVRDVAHAVPATARSLEASYRHRWRSRRRAHVLANARSREARRGDPRSRFSMPFAPAERNKRIALSLLLAAGLSVGLGVLVASTYEGRGAAQLGVASSLLVLTMSGSIVIARRATRWFGAEFGPRWSQRLITFCVCASFMVMPMPLLLELRDNQGLAIWLGLLFLAVFGRWHKNMERSANGELSFGCAIWSGFAAMFFTAIAALIVDSDPDEVVLIAAGIAGTVSLVVQASGWQSPATTSAAADRANAGSPRHEPAATEAVAGIEPAPRGAADTLTGGQGEGGTNISGSAGTSALSTTLRRWGVTRAFWALVAFALMGGAIVMFLFPLVSRNMNHDDVTSVIVGCTACAAFFIFALRKTTPVRRDGFWRETLRPFLISLTLFGIGGTITGISREWSHGHQITEDYYYSCLGDDGRVALLAVLILSSLLFVGLVLFTGRKRRPQRPFLQPQTGDQSPPSPADAANDASESQDG